MELPPRARRIPAAVHSLTIGDGTTSACAENTGLRRKDITITGNYLRVRGEYFTVTTYTGENMELPPRARRILHQHTQMFDIRGTTSACAENTPLQVSRIG